VSSKPPAHRVVEDPNFCLALIFYNLCLEIISIQKIRYMKKIIYIYMVPVKKCKDNEVVNPITNRCIDINGAT